MILLLRFRIRFPMTEGELCEEVGVEMRWDEKMGLRWWDEMVHERETQRQKQNESKNG